MSQALSALVTRRQRERGSRVTSRRARRIAQQATRGNCELARRASLRHGNHVALRGRRAAHVTNALFVEWRIQFIRQQKSRREERARMLNEVRDVRCWRREPDARRANENCYVRWRNRALTRANVTRYHNAERRCQYMVII